MSAPIAPVRSPDSGSSVGAPASTEQGSSGAAKHIAEPEPAGDPETPAQTRPSVLRVAYPGEPDFQEALAAVPEPVQNRLQELFHARFRYLEVTAPVQENSLLASEPDSTDDTLLPEDVENL